MANKNKKRKQLYIVIRGRRPGLYDRWFGKGGAAEQVEGFADAVYRGFYTQQEAVDWLRELDAETLPNLPPELTDLLDLQPKRPLDQDPKALLKAGKVLIYTDGGALENPGPGGYGVVLRFREHRRELSGGFQRTTNNRMELRACIEGLKALKRRSSVVLFSDSSYVVNGMTKGWARGWRARDWTLSNGQPVKNADLWQQLVDLDRQHDVQYRWLRGHSGTRDNERCDRLAVAAARGAELAIDVGFEQAK